MRNDIRLLLVPFLLFTCAISESVAINTADSTVIVVKHSSGTTPKLGFACELETPQLQELFNTPGVISDIRDMNANISIALIDLSEDRAHVIQQLNQAGVPVIAWLALPREQGYYMNSANSANAVARFAEFETWTAKYSLKWSGVGLDIEPNFAEFGKLRKAGKWQLISTILGRSMSISKMRQSKAATKTYSAFIKQIQDRGYPVQTYQLSFIADERKVHSTLLDRIIGVVQAKGNTEAMMLYTSFTHNYGSALIWSYGPQSQAIVVGLTGSGVDTTNSRSTPLTWKELSNDLIVASHFTNEIGIFSLEGCVKQGFLPLLKNFDWTRTVTLSSETLKKVNHFRGGVQTAIWIVTYLPLILLAIILIIVWMIRRRIRRKQVV
jgi:hypothetical protein